MPKIFDQLPIWFVIALLSTLTILVSFAVIDGRKVEFWPPTIHEKNNTPLTDEVNTDVLNDEINTLKTNISRLNDENKHLLKNRNEEQVIDLFPIETHKKTANKTSRENEKLIDNIKNDIDKIEREIDKKNELIGKLREEISNLSSQQSGINKIKDTFLFQLIVFHNDASCYGSTLNFTAGRARKDCIKKEILANRFIVFLSELELASNPNEKNIYNAKEELITLQEKYNFEKKGWYSIDVFKALVSEFHAKA